MNRSAARLPPLHRASFGSHTNGSVNIFSLRTTAWLGPVVVAAGLLGMAGCSSSSSSPASSSASPKTFTVKQIVLGETLKHSFQPNGKGAMTTESLSQPDDIVPLEEMERRHIVAALGSTAGVINGPKGAARILRLHPNTLRSRMEKLGITFKRTRQET